MLSPLVYAKLYEVVRSAPDADVLEIGAGRGAATVVIAQALIDSGKRSKVVAVEKFSGGSNVDFGGREENLRRVRDVFEEFGVSGRVELFPYHLTAENLEELEAMISTRDLSVLMIDADGRLDVHVPLLWRRIPPGAPLVLDDYNESYAFEERSERYPLGRTKELTCFRLVNKLVELGYLEIDTVIDHTVFARKRNRPRFDASDVDLLHEQVRGVEREYEAWRAQGSSAPGAGCDPDTC